MMKQMFALRIADSIARPTSLARSLPFDSMSTRLPEKLYTMELCWDEIISVEKMRSPRSFILLILSNVSKRSRLHVNGIIMLCMLQRAEQFRLFPILTDSPLRGASLFS